MPLDLTANPQNIYFRCVEDSNDSIMISDRRGLLVYVNPAWCQIYGYSREEAIGQSPKLLHSGLQSPDFYREMWSRITDPAISSWKGELINRAKDGTHVPVLLSITPFTNALGENAGFMGIAVDISYRRELEAKVAHQDRLASIGLLASGLAHEIGTPMGVIRGRAEFLMMKADQPVVKKNLEIIISQIDRISKLIRSLLRVSRSFSDVRLENVVVPIVAAEVIALVGQNFFESKAEIQNELPEDLQVRADFGRLEQVMLNLFMNSIHAIRNAQVSGQPGPHFLRLSVEPSPEAWVTLRVEDSGCGISKTNMTKLFKPFFTTKDIGEGTGLGLAIVARLVREMEGEVHVSSVEGKGTVFLIQLHAARSE